MTTHKPISAGSPPGAHEPLSPTEELEEDGSVAAVVAAGGLRAIEVLGIVLIGLLVCPPLAVLAFVTVVPLVVVALLAWLFVAVLSTPYLLYHHLRGRDGDHLSLLRHRLRRAARALIALAPHRIVADARKLDPGR